MPGRGLFLYTPAPEVAVTMTASHFAVSDVTERFLASLPEHQARGLFHADADDVIDLLEHLDPDHVEELCAVHGLKDAQELMRLLPPLVRAAPSFITLGFRDPDDSHSPALVVGGIGIGGACWLLLREGARRRRSVRRLLAVAMPALLGASKTFWQEYGDPETRLYNVIPYYGSLRQIRWLRHLSPVEFFPLDPVYGTERKLLFVFQPVQKEVPAACAAL